jgi:hypothetical protein
LRQPVALHQRDRLRPELLGNPFPSPFPPALVFEMRGHLFQREDRARQRYRLCVHDASGDCFAPALS